MLTAEQNDELTEVEPGTPMGEVLRRYWYPVAFTRELDEFPVKRASCSARTGRSASRSGRYGIVPEPCPHRRASLAYGVVEADGLRCPYHGWKFDPDGACLDQPAERDDTNFADRVRATPARRRSSAASSGPTSGRRAPAPCCRASTSTSWTASATSAGPTCRATTSRSWRTPSTRTTSSGCTGATSSSWAARRASPPPRRSARSTSRSASRVRVGHHQAPRARGRQRGERRLEGRAPAGVPVQHAGRRRGRRADADPGADRPDHHPVHALHGARPEGYEHVDQTADPGLPDPGAR